MKFEYSYLGSSAVDSSPNSTSMSFSPDTKREPTFFRGELAGGVPFREAISALHDVVVGDLRYKPKDRTEYKKWVEAQQQQELDLLTAGTGRIKEEMESIQGELNTIFQKSQVRSSAFNKARRRYWDFLYTRDYNAWYVFDPVITIHPDEIFFECFSQDESSYARLGVDYNLFKNIGDFACGTTNVDYSMELYKEFQKIRSYKTTSFEVDPSGFEVQTVDQTTFSDAYKEVKIDLPDSWVRGFLQVSSAMSLPTTEVDLHPMDLHNICFILRRKKEKKGPRSLRYLLKPGRPVSIVFDPWGLVLECPRSTHNSLTEQEIRLWGRRRIHVMERLIPIAKKIRLHLLGTGMPSFYVVEMDGMSFTLGLSGWTANDWSTAGNFDLMAPRAQVDHMTKQQVFSTLRKHQFLDTSRLARELNLDSALVLGALGAYTQAGRAIYDLNKKVYRLRELSREPLPMSKLRFANDREEVANRFLSSNSVRITSSNRASGELNLSGNVRDGYKNFNPYLIIDEDQRIVNANCSCNFYSQNKLYKGPCEHMLALRLLFNTRNYK